MKIDKCKWKYGKQAPLVIMMDDLANKYMIDKKDGAYIGADWGGRCKKKNSWYDFVQRNIFEKYPYAKMTCFLVVGRREDFIRNGKKNITLPIDANDEFIKFVNEVANDERFELSYHGFTHGEITENGFIQEWDTFSDISEAVQTIQKGQKLYQKVTGQKFWGGKYCGYARNRFSDESIIKSHFDYWCRHWDADIIKGLDRGEESLELGFFGETVDIPSTIDGSLFSLKKIRYLLTRKYMKALYYCVKYQITLESIIDLLVSRGQILSIQSHTSPIREDKERQSPNIIDDIKNIQYILDYVKKYDIWYATCKEINDYFRIYSAVDLQVQGDAIQLEIDEKLLKNVLDREIWIKIYDLDPEFKWYLRRGDEKFLLSQKDDFHITNLPVIKGKFEIIKE